MLDRYRIEQLLGQGGFGAVYLVSDQLANGELFAIKELVDTSKKERERFTLEGEILKRLDHPFLPHVYRSFEDEQNYRAYLVMDYIKGPNLEKVRGQQPEKRFPLIQTMQIMAPIISAVSYLHKQHPPIIHRDIKPANIIVSAEGTSLVDFGIAKVYDTDSTTTAIRRCSPGYGAPEQYAMGTNPQTDIYGLGATCYVLLTGLVPLDAFHRMTRIGGQQVDPLEPVSHFIPSIPRAVSTTIQKAMAINSSERYATVDEFWKSFQAAARQRVAPFPLPGDENEMVPHQPQLVLPGGKAGMPAEIVYRPRGTIDAGGSGGAYGLFAVLLALVLLILLLGIGLGTGFFSTITALRPVLPPPAHTVQQIPSPTHGATAQPTITPSSPSPVPSPTPSPSPSPSPSPEPTAFPTLSSDYAGTIHDQFTNPPTDSSMNLSQVKQQGTNITGHFEVGPGLTGSNNFNGTISANNTIQFLVASCCGHLPLFFQGTIHADRSISGTYCAYANNQCTHTEGYGTWSVTPSSSSSSSLLIASAREMVMASQRRWQ